MPWPDAAPTFLVEHSKRAFVERRVQWRLVDGHPYQWQPAFAMRELVDFPRRGQLSVIAARFLLPRPGSRAVHIRVPAGRSVADVQ
jgi:hypothetical protein